MDLGKTAGHGLDRLLGFDVVGVAAGEEMIVGITDGSQIVFEHPPDHLVLMPQGHEDGDPLARSVLDLSWTRRK